jgi:CHAT domain-containing protein/exonuclease VII small subunit
MENREYHALLNMLLQVQSEDELIALVQQHPELLSEEFLSYVQQQVDQMNPQEAITLIERLLLLAAIIHASVQADAPVSQPADAFDIPDHIPPSTDPRAAWAKPFREFIARAFRAPAPLQEALQRAQRAGAREIADFLSLLTQEQYTVALEQVPRLFTALQQQGRLEEAYSLLLLPIAIEASRVEQFRQFPLEQQMAVLQAGLTACEAGYRLSRALSDEACQALFLVVKGKGLRESRQLEAAVEAYQQALAIYRQLAQQQPQVYEPYLATTLNNLGTALRGLRRLEAAVEAFQQALAIYRQLAQQQPQVYEPYLATTLTNLGNALSDLRRLEAAVEAYQQALAIRRRLAQQQPEVYEPDLATTLTNLGNALSDLRRLEAAVEAYQQALAIYRQLAQQQPQVYEPDVAMTLNNLGNALSDLRRLEAAVEAFQQALAIYRQLAQQQPEVYEPDVAMTLNNLGIALRGLRRLEAAVEAFQQALAIYRQLAQQQPQVYEPDLATTLNGLGTALSDLRRLEAAVEAFQQALAIYRQLAQQQPEVYEPDVAMTLNNLGNALSDLRRLEAAVEAFQQALAIRRRLAQQQPEVYEPYLATTLTNLGIALWGLRRYEAAVEAFQQALAIRRRLAQQQPEVYEPDVATTLNNLGTALWGLRRLEAAVEAYQQALAIYNRHDIPDEKAQTLGNLGRLYLSERRYEDALPYLREATDLVERLRAEGLRPERRRQIMDEYLPLYEDLLICLMRLELYDEALAVAERGKSRLLIDLLTAQELRPKNAPEPLQRRYEQLLFQARAIADELERPDPPDLPPDARETRRAQLRQEHQQVSRELDAVLREIRQADPAFLPATQPLTREQIVQLAQEAQTTLLSLRVTEEGSYAFLVYPDGSSEAVVIPDFTLERLVELAVAGWAVDYYTDRDGWRQRMEARLNALYRELLSPVHRRLRAKLGAGVHPLLIVPNRALALLPLHACGWDENGQRRYWIDEFVIRYAPSLTLFRILWARERERRRRELLLAVANPTGDLPFAEYECEQIEARWGGARAQVLWREQGTRNAVLQNASAAHLLHFACHGVYDLANPLESPLLLANGETLTLGAMLEQLNLPHAQLVALSACETALTDPKEQADEHFGLTLGPLYAGAPTVWGTLWAVADVATGLLMGKAYDLLQAGRSKAEALREAQLWLRDLTAAQAQEILEAQAAAAGQPTREVALTEMTRLALAQLLPVQRRFALMDDTERPFAHPYFWAAFQCVGVSPRERLSDLWLAMSYINYRIILGKFAYDPSDGEVRFSVDVPIDQNTFTYEQFTHTMRVAIETAERYAPILRRIVAGELSAEQFIAEDRGHAMRQIREAFGGLLRGLLEALERESGDSDTPKRRDGEDDLTEV